MRKRVVTIAVAALAIPAIGSIAYGAGRSVSDHPAPQVVIPASSSSTTGGYDPTYHLSGADERPNHEADDLGDAHDDRLAGAIPATTTTTSRGDDGLHHDAGDDHGGLTTKAVGTQGGGPGSDGHSGSGGH